MFSSLQDAIKKLHENKKQTQPPPAKRPAIAPAAAAISTASSNTNIEDHDDALEFDFGTFGEMDDADDLLDGLRDEDLGLDIPDPSPPPPPPIRNPIQPLPPARSSPRPQSPAPGIKRHPRPPMSTPSRPVIHQSPRFTTPQRPSRPPQPNSGSQPFHSPYATPRPPSARSPDNVVHQVGSVVKSRPTTDTPATQPASAEIPGPAGLIGKQGPAIPATQRPASNFKTPMTKKVRSECAADTDFSSDTWAELLKFLKMPDYKPSNAEDITARSEHAKWPIRTVLQFTEIKRVPVMLVRTSDIHASDVDASAVLVDPTGEIRASVHKQVMRKYGQFLTADSSIILHDVVAMKMPGAPPFLVVTEGSINKIFAPDRVSRPGQVTVSQVNKPIDLVTQDSVPEMTAETPSKTSRLPVPDNPMLARMDLPQESINLDSTSPNTRADDLFDLDNMDMSFLSDDD